MSFISLPNHITVLMEKLRTAGYESFVVGGCVRDSLLGRPISDYDMTTNASPDEMKVVFNNFRVIETGIQHGTLTVLSENIPIEITTYRIDGEYLNHRKPASVTFTRNLRDDLARRDFTINAMAYNPDAGLIDLYGGENDLHKHMIRCVGDPFKRFEEDALRILRGIRFASQIGFSIDEITCQAMYKRVSDLHHISAERKQNELNKILIAPYAEAILKEHFEIILHLLPQISDLRDDLNSTLSQISRSPTELDIRLAVLFSHSSVEEAVTALSALKYDTKTIEAVIKLISYQTCDLRNDRKSVKQIMSSVGVDTTQKLIAFLGALDASFNPAPIKEMVAEIIANNEPYTRSMLAVTGRDLKAIGIIGKNTGFILKVLLDAVMDGRLTNDRDALLSYVKSEELL